MFLLPHLSRFNQATISWPSRAVATHRPTEGAVFRLEQLWCQFGIPKNSPLNDEISYIFMSETSENCWFPKKMWSGTKDVKHIFFSPKNGWSFHVFTRFFTHPKLGPCCDGCDRPGLAGYHHHSKRLQQPL